MIGDKSDLSDVPDPVNPRKVTIKCITTSSRLSELDDLKKSLSALIQAAAYVPNPVKAEVVIEILDD